jgi:hypothetical protein
MIGTEAGEVMAVVQMAMLAGLPYTDLHTDLRDAVLAHPTMAEGLGSLFSNVPPRLSFLECAAAALVTAALRRAAFR